MDDELDPLLRRAYQAERARMDALEADLGDAHARVLEAALRRAPRGWPLPRVLAAVVATAVLAGGLGFYAGRRPMGAETPPPALDAGVLDAAPVVPDAAPVVPDAAPAVVPDAAPARPRRVSRELDEPLLIDQARTALRRRLVDEALAALAQHERRFPAGQLVEEREVLYIEAELLRGDRAAADERIARYLARFPLGFFRRHVESLRDQ
jgi:hypothetical protein